MPKKIPMRKCVATGEQLPKKELLRVVRTPEGTLAVDTTGRTNGHGAYLKKNNALAKALSQKIPDEFWDEIAKAMK